MTRHEHPRARTRGFLLRSGLVLLLVLILFLWVSGAHGQGAKEAIYTAPSNSSIKDVTAGGGMLYWFEPVSAFFGLDSLNRMPQTLGEKTTLDTWGTFPEKNLYGMVADDQGLQVYYANNDQILFYPVDNPTADPIVSQDKAVGQFPGGSWPSGRRLAVDAKYVYWFVEKTIGVDYRRLLTEVVRAPRDGSATSAELVSGVDRMAGEGRSIVTSPSGAYVYFLDAGGIHIAPCSSSPCGTPEHLYTPPSDVSPPAGRDLLYVGSNYGSEAYPVLYWVEYAPLQRIRRLRCIFSQWKGRICFPSTMAQASGTAWKLYSPVVQSGYLFYIERSDTDARIKRVQLPDGTPEIIYSSTAASLGTFLAADDRYVYFLGQIPQKPPVDTLFRLPLDAQPITWDLQIEGMEITQGIQSMADDLPLVAGKRTYVRAYASRDPNDLPATTVNAVLEGSRNGTPLPGSPLRPIRGPISVPEDNNSGLMLPPDRWDLTTSWVFELPDSWTADGSTTLTLRIDPDGAYPDRDPLDNTSQRTVQFGRTAPNCVVFIPVKTTGPLASLENPTIGPMVDLANRLWPVNQTFMSSQNEPLKKWDICWKRVAEIFGQSIDVPYPCEKPYDLTKEGDRFRVLVDLVGRGLLSDDPDVCQRAQAKVVYVGLVHHDAPSSQNGGITLGMGSMVPPFNWVAWVKLASPDDRPNGQEFGWPESGTSLGHELMHTDELPHVNGGCGARGTNPFYPIDGGFLGEDDPAGFFVFDGPTWTVLGPRDARDIMTYCRPRWTSPFTWNYLWTVRRLRLSLLPLRRPAATASTVLISGQVLTTTQGASLHYAWVYPNAALSPGIRIKLQSAYASLHAAQVATNTNYSLRLLDANGSVLAEEPVYLLKPSDPATHRPFFLTFPAPVGTVARIELLYQDTVIASRAPGPGAPAVQILRPTAGETVRDTLTLRWEASDPDAIDTLLFTLQYSPDDGTHWYTFLSEFPATPGTDTYTLSIPNPSLPGSQPGKARIRVVASDGYHTTLATSPGFTFANRRPTALIASPAPDQHLPPGQPISVRGLATDPEDGALDPASFHWTLNGQDAGTGEELLLAGLAPGTYTLNLQVQDSAALTHSTTITFFVDPVGIPLVTSSPTLDGYCDDPAYDNATTLFLKPYWDGSRAKVRLLRTSSYLWACFSNLKKRTGSTIPWVGLRMDVDHSRDTYAQSNDYGFFVKEDGTPFTRSGNGSGGFSDPGPGGLSARVSANTAFWEAELRIDRSILGGWNQPIGLDLAQYWVRWTGDDYHWPYGSRWNRPYTWAHAVLGTVPRIARLSPDAATAGTGPLSLVVQGENLEDGAQVLWDGTPLATTFGSATLLTATVPAANLASPGTAQITVQNPGGTELTSNPATFVIESPQPLITGLSPARAFVNQGPLTLHVYGQNFLPGAQLLWNGDPLPTTRLSSTHLRATVPASNLTVVRSVLIAVQNPGPNNPVSPGADFFIGYYNLFLPSVLR